MTTPIIPHHIRPGRGLGLFLALLSAVAVAGVRAASPAIASAAEVKTEFQKFVTAWEQKDLAAATGVYAPEAVVYDPDPPGVFATPEAIKGWTAGTFQALDHITIAVSDLRVHTSGAVAWLTAHYVFKALAGGKPAGDEGNLSTVWVKQSDGSYQLALFHASIPPPPPPPPVPPPGK